MTVAEKLSQGNTQLSMERVYKRQEMKGNHGPGYGDQLLPSRRTTREHK
jgi:hypothetical protein